MPDAIQTLAEFICKTSIDGLPEDVRHDCKRQVLDALTCAVASHRVPNGAIAARTGAAIGGLGRATIVGSEVTTSAGAAAFANTQMLLALDITSNLMNSQGLAGAIIFPALALAETLGAPGSRVIEAIVCGYEVAARVRRAMPPRTTWGASEPQLHWTIFGAAAAAARMLGLDAGKAVHCLALAGMSAQPMNLRIFSDAVGSMAKYALMGNVAALGITAAMLAREGFTGDPAFLDEQGGYWRSVATTLHNHDALTERLGDRWWVSDVYFKRLPSGTPNQPALHTIDLLIRTHRIRPEEIEAIEISRGLGTEQLFVRSLPKDYIEAQFSLPFQIGALAAGIPPRDWGTDLSNPLAAKIAKSVALIRNEQVAGELAKAQDEAGGALSWWWFSDKTYVRVRARGEEFASWSQYGQISDEELCEKFRHYAHGFLSEESIDGTIASAFRLDRVERLSELMCWLGRSFERK